MGTGTDTTSLLFCYFVTEESQNYPARRAAQGFTLLQFLLLLSSSSSSSSFCQHRYFSYSLHGMTM